MEAIEARLRCIEAAAKTPMVHSKGQAEGVLETASLWFDYVFSGRKADAGKPPLGLPKKS